MFEKLRAVIHFNRGVNAFRNGHAARAIVLVKKAIELRKPKPYHIAFLAQAYAANRDRHNARFSFTEALNMSKSSNNKDDKYVHKYCEVYLTLMDSSDPVDDLVSSAVLIHCRPVIKRWLPLVKEDSRIRVAY